MPVVSIEGNLVVPKGAKFGIVASRFNHFIVDHLVGGAVDALLRHGAEESNITVVRVPGAWELPLALQKLGRGKLDGIIAVGAVIRGSTPHFDYVAGEAAKGAAKVQLDNNIPVGFGLLTTDTIEQAIERAGTKAGNKGWDAAMSVIEMVTVSRQLEGVGF